MAKKSPSDKIRAEAVRRGIPYLMHFTQVSNLPGIVRDGLLSRAAILQNEIVARASAEHRLDGADEAVSVSISAMNYDMFQSKRRDAGNRQWVVLLLDPSVLWTHSCRFLNENAARKSMKDATGFRGGPWAFEQMFLEEVIPSRFKGQSYRQETGIPDHFTTLPAAEVQVFERIAPEAIIQAWADTLATGQWVDRQLKAIPDGRSRDVTVMPFAPRFRNDYASWG